MLIVNKMDMEGAREYYDTIKDHLNNLSGMFVMKVGKMKIIIGIWT